MVVTSSRAAAGRLQLVCRSLAEQHFACDAAALVGMRSERGDLEGDGEREAGGDLGALAPTHNAIPDFCMHGRTYCHIKNSAQRS